MVFLYIFLACALLCGAILFLILPAKSTRQQRSAVQGFNCAHRGLHSKDKTLPENSLAAFAVAANAGDRKSVV